MAFWGAVISRKSPYIHCAHGHNKRLRITQASLGVTDVSKEKRAVVICTQGEEKQFPLCVLIPEKVESQILRIELDTDDDVEISVNGSSKVSLSGYFLNGRDSLISNKDTSDTDGENIERSDSKGSCDSEEDEDDDYDYDDAFIVDDRNLEDDSDCPKSKLKYFGSRKKKSSRARYFCEEEVNSSKHHKAVNSPVKPIAKPKYEGKRLTPAFDI